jgi:hypothetical protein
MMEAVRTSETSVYSNENKRSYIPEGSNLNKLSWKRLFIKILGTDSLKKNYTETACEDRNEPSCQHGNEPSGSIKAWNFLTSCETKITQGRLTVPCSRYSPQITSWSPQGMRILRQCKVPGAEVMFVTIQRQNIRPSKKEMTKAVTTLPNCPMFAVRIWITTSPYRWPIGSLPSTCMLYTPPALH